MVTPIFFWGEHWGSVCCHLISFGGGLGVTTVTPFVLWGGGKGGELRVPPPRVGTHSDDPQSSGAL